MRRVSIAVAVLLVPFAASPAFAATMGGGYDCWATESPGTQIKIPNLASNFPGCTLLAPLDGIVQMMGNPPVPTNPPDNGPCDNVQMTWVNPHGTPVSPDDNHKVGQTTGDTSTIDTVVRRTSGTFPNAGASDTIEIEIVQLSLRSVGCPIQVDCGGIQTWMVAVTEDGDQTPGNAEFTANSVSPLLSGSVDLTSLPVNYKTDFTRCDAAGTRPSLTGSIDFTTNPDGTFIDPSGAQPPITNRWLELLLAAAIIALATRFLLARRRTAAGGPA